MFLTFSFVFYLLSGREELRLLASLASIYHNLLVEEALKMTPALCDDISVNKTDDAGNDNFEDFADSTQSEKCSYKTAQTSFYDNCSENSWDEEMHGDQVVYDDTFEQNEDLVPWLMTKDADELFGFNK